MDDPCTESCAGAAGVAFTKGHSMAITSAVFEEGVVISASKDSSIRVWDAVTGHLLQRLCGHQSSVLCLAYRCGMLISGSIDGTAQTWSVISRSNLLTFKGHSPYGVTAVSFYQAVTVISGGLDGRILKWKVDSGQIVGDYTGVEGGVDTLIVDESVVAAACGGGSAVYIWDVDSCQPLRKIDVHRKGIRQLFPFIGSVFSTSNDGSVKEWIRDTGHVVQTFDYSSMGVDIVGAVVCQQQLITATSHGFVFGFALDGASGVDACYSATLLPSIVTSQLKYLTFSVDLQSALATSSPVEVSTVFPSDNGRWVAVGTKCGQIIVINTTSGKVERVLGSLLWRSRLILTRIIDVVVISLQIWGFAFDRSLAWSDPVKPFVYFLSFLVNINTKYDVVWYKVAYWFTVVLVLKFIILWTVNVYGICSTLATMKRITHRVEQKPQTTSSSIGSSFLYIVQFLLWWFMWLMSRPLIIPIVSILSQSFSCSSQGIWRYSVDSQCFHGSHLAYFVISIILLFFYIIILLRMCTSEGDSDVITRSDFISQKLLRMCDDKLRKEESSMMDWVMDWFDRSRDYGRNTGSRTAWILQRSNDAGGTPFLPFPNNRRTIAALNEKGIEAPAWCVDIITTPVIIILAVINGTLDGDPVALVVSTLLPLFFLNVVAIALGTSYFSRGFSIFIWGMRGLATWTAFVACLCVGLANDTDVGLSIFWYLVAIPSFLFSSFFGFWVYERRVRRTIPLESPLSSPQPSRQSSSLKSDPPRVSSSVSSAFIRSPSALNSLKNQQSTVVSS